MTRGWKTRERSLPAAAGAIGSQTLERRASSREGAEADSVILQRGVEVQEGPAVSVKRNRGGGRRKTFGGSHRRPRHEGTHGTHDRATVVRGNP
jgi:hypothetical protein